MRELHLLLFYKVCLLMLLDLYSSLTIAGEGTAEDSPDQFLEPTHSPPQTPNSFAPPSCQQLGSGIRNRLPERLRTIVPNEGRILQVRNACSVRQRARESVAHLTDANLACHQLPSRQNREHEVHRALSICSDCVSATE